MSRREYKPGDRVRVTEDAWIERARGKVGTVQSFYHEHHSDYDFVCRVLLDGDRDDKHCTFCHDKSLEPLVEKKKLSVNAALSDALDDIEEMMQGRHRKYGPGNIAKHGTTGIHVRLDDKFSRLEAGAENFDDETVENTLDDIIGYALIWKLWLRKQWPGSE